MTSDDKIIMQTTTTNTTTTLQDLILATMKADDAYQAAFTKSQRTGIKADQLLTDSLRRDRQLLAGMIDKAVP